MLHHNGLIDDLKKVIAEEMRPSQVIVHISYCELQAWGHSNPMVSANNTTTGIEGLLSLSSNMLYQILVTAKMRYAKSTANKENKTRQSGDYFEFSFRAPIGHSTMTYKVYLEPPTVIS